MGINVGGNTNSGGLTLGGGQPQSGGLNLGRETAPQPQAPIAPVSGGLQLSKGQKLDLTKGNPGLDVLKVGLGWDVNVGGQAFDLDTEVFMLGADSRVVSPNHVVFCNYVTGGERVIA